MRDPDREYFYSDEFHKMMFLMDKDYFIVVRNSPSEYFIKKFCNKGSLDVNLRDETDLKPHSRLTNLKVFKSYTQAAMYCTLNGFNLISHHDVVEVKRKRSFDGFEYLRFVLKDGVI